MKMANFEMHIKGNVEKDTIKEGFRITCFGLDFFDCEYNDEKDSTIVKGDISGGYMVDDIDTDIKKAIESFSDKISTEVLFFAEPAEYEDGREMLFVDAENGKIIKCIDAFLYFFEEYDDYEEFIEAYEIPTERVAESEFDEGGVSSREFEELYEKLEELWKF